MRTVVESFRIRAIPVGAGQLRSSHQSRCLDCLSRDLALIQLEIDNLARFCFPQGELLLDPQTAPSASRGPCATRTVPATRASVLRPKRGERPSGELGPRNRVSRLSCRFSTLREDTFRAPRNFVSRVRFAIFIFQRTEPPPGGGCRTNVVIQAEVWKHPWPASLLAALPAPDRSDDRTLFLPSQIYRTCCQRVKQRLLNEPCLANSRSPPTLAS